MPGVRISPGNLLRQWRGTRAAAASLTNLMFEHGDARNLRDLPDGRFDLTMSIFGAMFAPEPAEVAREMVRVTRPGGRVVMGNWIPGDPTLVAQILKVSSAYSPPMPAGFVSPMLWGQEALVEERFAAAGVPAANIAFTRRTFTFRAAQSPVAYVDDFRNFYGPTMNAYAAAAADGREEALHAELVALFEQQNTSGSPDLIVVPATYLLVTVSR